MSMLAWQVNAIECPGPFAPEALLSEPKLLGFTGRFPSRPYVDWVFFVQPNGGQQQQNEYEGKLYFSVYETGFRKSPLALIEDVPSQLLQLPEDSRGTRTAVALSLPFQDPDWNSNGELSFTGLAAVEPYLPDDFDDFEEYNRNNYDPALWDPTEFNADLPFLSDGEFVFESGWPEYDVPGTYPYNWAWNVDFPDIFVCLMDVSVPGSVSVNNLASGMGCEAEFTVTLPPVSTILPGVGTVTDDGYVLAAWFAKFGPIQPLWVVAVMEIDGEVETLIKYRDENIDVPWEVVQGAMSRPLSPSTTEVYIPYSNDIYIRNGEANGQQVSDLVVRLPPPDGSGACFEVLTLFHGDLYHPFSIDSITHPRAYSLGDVMNGDWWLWRSDGGGGEAVYLPNPDNSFAVGTVIWRHVNGTAPGVAELSWDLEGLEVDLSYDWALNIPFAFSLLLVGISAWMAYGVRNMPEDEDPVAQSVPNTPASGAGSAKGDFVMSDPYGTMNGAAGGGFAQQMPQAQHPMLQQHSMPAMMQQQQPVMYQQQQQPMMMQHQHSMPAMMQQQQPVMYQQQQQPMMMQHQHSMPAMMQQQQPAMYQQQQQPMVMQHQHSMSAMMQHQQPIQPAPSFQNPAVPLPPSNNPSGSYIDPDAAYR